MPEDIARIDPDFTTIIDLCRKELEVKYRSYGNTWLESDDKYYKKRIFNEVEEYHKAPSVEAERRKLLNIINIACMAWQTAKANRHKDEYDSVYCSNCKMPLNLKFHVVKDDRFVCTL